MISGTARASVLACAWMVSCGVGRADAQTAVDRPTDPAALAHYNAGNAHYKVRDFDKAAEEYKAGALIQPAARFEYNLGQCYRQLGKEDDEVWYYERYLHSGFASPEDTAQINQWLAEAKAKIDQREKSSPPPQVEPTPAEPHPGVLPPTHVEAWYQDYFAWALTGSGLIVGGVGTWLLGDASSLRDQANSTSNQQQQNSLRNSADSRQLAGTILAIGGGAILVTGIVKLTIHDHEPATSTAVNVGVSPNGVFVFGRF